MRSNASTEKPITSEQYFDTWANALLEAAAGTIPITAKQQTAIDAIRQDAALADDVIAKANP